jgi:hypothetical protein
MGIVVDDQGPVQNDGRAESLVDNLKQPAFTSKARKCRRRKVECNKECRSSHDLSTIRSTNTHRQHVSNRSKGPLDLSFVQDGFCRSVYEIHANEQTRVGQLFQLG